VIELSVDGAPLHAPEGQSIAAALLAAGRSALRSSPGGGPRGIYCGIGVCQECRVHVEGQGVVRACVTPAAAGMRITTGVT
jgi:NADH dehydrogenase/NADH:ubiquinone oxidoreductase subunit G